MAFTMHHLDQDPYVTACKIWKTMAKVQIGAMPWQGLVEGILHKIHWNSSEFWQGYDMKSETCAHIDRIELASAMIGHDVLGSVEEWSAAKVVILRHVPHRNVPPGSLCLWQNSLHSPGANQTLSCGTNSSLLTQHFDTWNILKHFGTGIFDMWNKVKLRNPFMTTITTMIPMII